MPRSHAGLSLRQAPPMSTMARRFGVISKKLDSSALRSRSCASAHSASRDEARRARCEELDVEISPDMKDVDVSQQVYEKLVEEKTMNPCFVTHVAKDLVPLAKLNKENPDVVDVYELVINGQEISPGYSELNDPDVQKERLEHQAAGETQRVDYDFIETLEYGMPSAGGIGIGIDRVIMMLTGASSIRDVLLFPQLKRKDS